MKILTMPAAPKPCAGCGKPVVSKAPFPYCIECSQIPTIRLLRNIPGDWPLGHTSFAKAGIHAAHLNPHGAVSVIANDGKLLGIMPDEFEWVKKPGEAKTS